MQSTRYRLTHLQLAAAREEAHKAQEALLSLPKKAETGPKGPAKRGSLHMGAKVVLASNAAYLIDMPQTLFCELIGGQTLELSDTSQVGHTHVSKVGASY